MESKYALIIDNKVENIILWDGESEYEFSSSLVLIPDGLFVDIGFDYIDGEFIDPNPPAVEQTETPAE